MTEAEMRTFAVNTTAMLDVLRTNVQFLLMGVIEKVPADGRERIYAAMLESTGEPPARYNLSSPAATKFYEEVAEATRHHAEMLVQDLRKALE